MEQRITLEDEQLGKVVGGALDGHIDADKASNQNNYGRPCWVEMEVNDEPVTRDGEFRCNYSNGLADVYVISIQQTLRFSINNIKFKW